MPEASNPTLTLAQQLGAGQNAMKVFINLAKGKLDDPLHLARDVSKIGHWGNGDYEILVRKEDELQYIMTLVTQSFKENS